MKTRAENLATEVSRGLKPCYLVSGDEPLLLNEAADCIRQAARDHGFSERQVFHAGTLDWADFLAESQAMSLFSERRIMELRISSSKPGEKGSKAIVQFCEALSDDILLLVTAGKLDRNQQRSKWVTTLEKAGTHIQVWPVQPRDMPGWLNQRLKATGIEADHEAVSILAERVEGNLLAAQQEVEKLSILAQGTLDAPAMTELVVNNARYDVFSLIDRCLAGATAEALTNLRGLQEEGAGATLVLWSLAREVRQLVQIHSACSRGQSLQAAIRAAGVWEKKQQLVRTAARRTSARSAAQMLRLCKNCDTAIKSSQGGDPWLILRSLVAALCGQPAFDLSLEISSP